MRLLWHPHPASPGEFNDVAWSYERLVGLEPTCSRAWKARVSLIADALAPCFARVLSDRERTENAESEIEESNLCRTGQSRPRYHYTNFQWGDRRESNPHERIHSPPFCH